MARRVSWLNLHEVIPQRDVRRLIYKKLTNHERLVVELAHGVATRKPSMNLVHYAALNGFLSLLQWAHSEGVSWNELTCSFAAHNNHFKVVRWAVDHGCPVSQGVLGKLAAHEQNTSK